jgi:hypothetical protein
MFANITGCRQNIPFLLILYQKRILSAPLIASHTMHENAHAEGHKLTVTMIANTKVFDNMSKHRQTIGEIILIHEPKRSLLSSKIPVLHQYKITFRLVRLCVVFKYFINTLLYIVTNNPARETKCGQCLREIMNEWLNEK